MRGLEPLTSSLRAIRGRRSGPAHDRRCEVRRPELGPLVTVGDRPGQLAHGPGVDRAVPIRWLHPYPTAVVEDDAASSAQRRWWMGCMGVSPRTVAGSWAWVVHKRQTRWVRGLRNVQRAISSHPIGASHASATRPATNRYQRRRSQPPTDIPNYPPGRRAGHEDEDAQRRYSPNAARDGESPTE